MTNNQINTEISSQDIVFQRIIQFDWSREFLFISHKQEFIQTGGLYCTLIFHNDFYWRSFSAKTNDILFGSIRKTSTFDHFGFNK